MALDLAVRCDPRLIVPLDFPTVADARRAVGALDDAVAFYKVGLELFATGEGMDLARELKAKGKQVFLDWKLHDIGTTVQRSAAVLADSGCDFLTVHAEPQVLEAAVRGRGRSNLKILGVTVLTSLTDADLLEMGFSETARSLVERRIHHAMAAGADGVIASPHEAALARSIGGEGFLVVTPGVRPDWSARNDQARAATPAEALKAGASHIVCGRPITAANDPREAALRIAAEMAGA
ncbi:MAG: orotidine-5'-phosphate decarboxylase [Phenylobacterium sp.]|jgi:orotidine-5'-phosphate decarboxylase|uniref:orotidine-5'-phosphate decarboxylase n=1 Tax=Phenylobacterium sp. TaxID=1871053 RepID=UPI00391953CE